MVSEEAAFEPRVASVLVQRLSCRLHSLHIIDTLKSHHRPSKELRLTDDYYLDWVKAMHYINLLEKTFLTMYGMS